MPSCISHSSLRVRRKQRDIKRAATAPKTAPGKKPAAIAPGGKEGHEFDISAHVVVFVDFSDEGDGTGVMVAWGVVELVAVVDAVLVEVDTDDDAVLVDELCEDVVAVAEAFWSREQVLSPRQV